MVRFQAGVAGEIERLAEPDAGADPQPRPEPAGRLNSNVPTMAVGITGAPDSRASLATPVLPRYSRPSGVRVPSG